MPVFDGNVPDVLPVHEAGREIHDVVRTDREEVSRHYLFDPTEGITPVLDVVELGLIYGHDIHADLHQLVSGRAPGRESDAERIYFNAVGLAYIDVAIALAMYRRALSAGVGRELDLQQCMIFEHPDIIRWVRL